MICWSMFHLNCLGRVPYKLFLRCTSINFLIEFDSMRYYGWFTIYGNVSEIITLCPHMFLHRLWLVVVFFMELKHSCLEYYMHSKYFWFYACKTKFRNRILLFSMIWVLTFDFDSYFKKSLKGLLILIVIFTYTISGFPVEYVCETIFHYLVATST